MIPIVAIEFEAPPPLELQQVLIDACSASLSHLDCAPAARTKGDRPAAVAMLSAPEPDVVVIELADARRGVWLTRRLDFAPADAPSERWRSAGFSIGALLGPSDVAPEPAGAEGLDEPPAPQRAARSEHAPRALHFGLGLAGAFGVGLDQAASRAGGELNLWATPWRRIAPHVTFAYAAALDTPELLHLRFVDLGVGLGWHWRGSEAWAGRVRLQVNVQNASASARSQAAPSEQAEERSAWVLGARAGLDGVWSFAEHWSAVLSSSLVFQDGATRINVEDRRVAGVPARGVLLGLGLEYGE